MLYINLTQEELMKSLEQSRLEKLNALDEYSSAYDLKVLELDEIEGSSPGSVNSQNKTVLPLNPDELPSDISISDLIGLVNENAIGVTEEKYMNEYILKYKKRSGKNTRGNNSSNISLRDLTTSNYSLSQNNKAVNTDYAQNSNNNTKNLAMHQGRQEMQILRNFQKLRGLRVGGALNSEEIMQQTGWFRGYDNKWRFEIDDSRIALRMVKNICCAGSSSNQGKNIVCGYCFYWYKRI